MKINTLPLTKAAFIMLLWLLNNTIVAQATYTLEYPSPTVNLDACGAPLEVRLNIQNTSSSQTLNQTYSLSFNQTGLYFVAGSSSIGNVTVTNPQGNAVAEGDIKRTITVSILPNSFAEVIFNVKVGCTLEFDNNNSSLTLNSPLKLEPASGSLTLMNNISYNVTQKGYLNYDEFVNFDGATRTGDLVIRKHVIINKSSFPFTGYVKFADLNLSDALEAQTVRFIYEDHAVSPVVSTVRSVDVVTNTLLNGNGLVKSVIVPAQTWLIIEETVKVVGCLDYKGGSSPVVQWSCSQYDFLPPVKGIDASVSKPTADPQLVLNHNKVEMNASLDCYEGNHTVSRISFSNPSTTSARNVRLVMIPRDPIMIPVGGVRVYLHRRDGSVEGPYAVNYTANNITPDYMSVTGMHKKYTQQQLLDVIPYKENLTLNDIKYLVDDNAEGNEANVIATRTTDGRFSNINYDFLYYNYFETAKSIKQGGNYAYAFPYYTAPLAQLLPQAGITGQSNDPDDVFFIKQLVIDKLVTANNEYVNEIILHHNDSIVVEYDEYSLCTHENKSGDNLITSATFLTSVRNECRGYFATDGFSPLYTGNPNNSNRAYNAVLVTANGILNAGVSNTQGEVDRCPETADGKVENMSFTMRFPNMASSYTEVTGALQFKLYLEDGLDLDRSLELPLAWGRTKNTGYNNLTNNKTGCDKNNCDEEDCHPSTNVVAPENRYNFKITLRNGAVVPASALTITRIAADKDITTINDGMSPVTFNVVKSYFDVTTKKSTFLYSISVDLTTLYSLITPSTSNKEEALRRELDGATVSFDVRAYCASKNQIGATKWQMECLWDRCPSFIETVCGTTLYREGTTSEIKVNSYNALPLFSVGSAILVNCPGCTTPGSELVDYTLIRTNVGLIDADLNGEPDVARAQIPLDHPNRRIVTTGDTMQAHITITMPDGEDGLVNGIRVGCTKAELDSRAYLLDNFYLKFISVNEKITLVPGSVQAAVVSGGQSYTDETLNWITISQSDVIANGTSSLMVRVRASAIPEARQLMNGILTPNFHTNHTVILRALFTVGDVSTSAKNIDFDYSAGFSGCDDCTDFGAVLPAIPTPGQMADANPASKNPPAFSFTELDAVGDKAYFWCTNGGNVISYIPYVNVSQIDFADNYDERSCVKRYSINNRGFFTADGGNWIYDAFPGEYRRFFGNNSYPRHELPIPTGFEPYKIYATYYHRQGNIYQEENYLTITDPVAIHNMVSSQPSNTLFNSKLNLTMTLIPDEDNVVPNLMPLGEPTYHAVVSNQNATSLTFPLDEENFQISIDVYLRPINCTDVPAVTSLRDNWNGLYKPLTYIPDHPSALNPNILKNLPAQPAYLPRSSASDSPVIVTAPQSQITAMQGNINLSTSINYIQVPVRIDCANIDRVSFPFFTVSGPAMKKGLKLVGIYMGNKDRADADLNPLNSPYLFKHHVLYNNDPANPLWIVGIDEYGGNQNYDSQKLYSLSKNSQTYFTLVFSYECGNCSPIMDCKTPAANLNGTFCLNSDEMYVGYGWNCNAYPDFNTLASVCKSYSPLVYNVSTSKVGLTTNHYINNTLYTNTQTASVPSCTDFVYEVELSSCYRGTLNNFEVDFTLPAGVSINTSALATITLSDLFDVTIQPGGNGYTITSKNSALGLPREVPNPSDPNYPTIYSVIRLSVPMKLNCSFTSGNILTDISATTYCGTPVSIEQSSRTITTPYDAQQIDDITPSQVQVQTNAYAITVNYNITTPQTHTNYLKINLPAQFTKQGTNDHTITLAIPPSGTGTEVIAITPVNIQCDRNYDMSVQMLGTYPVTCGGESCMKEVPAWETFYVISMPPFSVTTNNISGCVNSGTQLNTTISGNSSSIYSYKWFKNGILINGAISSSFSVLENGIYSTEISDGLCMVTKAWDQVFITPEIYAIGPAGSQATFLCGTLDVKASVRSGTAPYAGSWTKMSDNTSANADFTQVTTPVVHYETIHSTTSASMYKLLVIDANYCSAIRMYDVVDDVDIVPPAPVCPGETPGLTITNLGLVLGTYEVGWFDATLDENDRVLLPQITYEGYYKAAAIIPGCTLTTADAYHIQYKSAPAPFTITPEGFIFSCDDDVHVASITNKAANDRNANGDYYDDNISYRWSNGATTLDDQTFIGRYSVSVTARDVNSGCVTNSSSLTIETPSLKITRSCTGIAGQVKLTASANFPEQTYQWWSVDPVTKVKTLITTGTSGVNKRDLTVTQTGYYAVTLNHNPCGVIEAAQYENMIVSAAPNADLLDDLNARFEGIVTCADSRLFNSDLGCIDRSYYDSQNPNYINPANYGTTLPGNYIINYSGLSANNWNPGFWQGSGYNSSGFMIVDGTPVLSKNVVWRMDDVPVTQGHYHLFRAMVRNIASDKPPVPQESPQVALYVTYYDANGDVLTTSSQSRKILFNNTNQQWVELSGFTPTEAFAGSTGIRVAVKAKLELVIESGTALGRDFAIDNISFIPVGLCDNIQSILDVTGRNCGSVASVDFYQKVSCGAGVTFNVFDLATDPNVTYTWKDASGSTVLGSGKSFTATPTATTSYKLVVANASKGCSFEQSVTAVKLPGVTLVADDKQICSGASVQLNASGANSYVWVPSTGLSNPNIANPVASGLTSLTTYVLIGTSVSGCTATKQVTVGVLPVPVINLSVPNTGSLCVGTPLTINATGAVSYTWASRPDLVPNGNSAVLTLASDPGNTNVANTIEVVGYIGSCASLKSITVNRKELPEVTLSNATICNGAYGDFDIKVPAVNDYTYSWNTTNGLVGSLSNPLVSLPYAQAYQLTVSSPSTSCSVVKATSVGINYGTCNAPVYNTATTTQLSTIPDHSSYNFGTNGAFTLEAWVNFSTTQPVSYPAILSKRTTGSNGFLWCMDIGGSRMIFQIAGTNYYSSNFTSLYDGQCHYLAVTRSTSGALVMYIDGVVIGSASSATQNMNVSGIIRIANDVSVQPLRGSVSEVRIWNIALTGTQIPDQMNNIFATGTAGLISYYKFKQINTQVIVDQGSLRNNGYYGNSALNTTNDPDFTGTFCGGPKILTVSSPGLVCAGSNATINFTTTGFPSGIQIQVFRSDANGVFSSSPNSVTTTTANSYTYTFTAPSTPGSGYRIKVAYSTFGTEVISAPFEVTTQCNGITFDGGDRVTIPHNNSYNITGDFTFEAWVNFNNSGQPNNPMLLSKRANTSEGFAWYMVNSGQQMYLQLTGTNYSTTVFNSLYDGQCHHLAVRRISGTVTFFLDGVALNFIATTRSLVSVNTTPLLLGWDQITSNGVKGTLNEIRIWNTGRSNADIANNRTTVYSPATANLIGYWRFKEVSGTQVVTDESATANHGLLGNAAAIETTDPARSGLTCFANDKVADSFEEESNEPDITYYPNPFDKVLTVLVQDVATEETTATIQLMNVNGVEVYKGEIQLNVPNELHLELPAGIYMAIVRYHNNSMYQHKVIKVQ